MSREGHVLPAARAKRLDSLNKLADELLSRNPRLFRGVAARSLGAKLSDLNRGVVTWWKSRPQATKALERLIDVDLEGIIEAGIARRHGHWPFAEFPELKPLDLSSDEPAPIYDFKEVGVEDSERVLEDWFTFALSRGNDYRSLLVTAKGVCWLQVPRGMGLELLLARIEACRRVAVLRSETLVEACVTAPRSGPVVLAPSGRIKRDELVHLADLLEQPVLVVSHQHLPQADTPGERRDLLPSWEWLVGSRSDRTKLRLTSRAAGALVSSLGGPDLRQYSLTLRVDWRNTLLRWAERRLGTSDTLFTASGLATWLDTFDPDEVFFPSPGATLSLARSCHQSGERRLPSASRVDAGLELLRRLGIVDTRYLDLLKQLVKVAWMDTRRPWDAARPWQDWLQSDLEPESSQALARPKTKKRAAVTPKGGIEAKARPIDREAALHLRLLIPTNAGEYRFSSQAEACLVLRDLLVSWIDQEQHELWASPAFGDQKRQQIVDAVLRSVDPKVVQRLCQQSTQLVPWSAASLGATEALFVAAGLRMADGSLSYTSDLKAVLEAVFVYSQAYQGSPALPLGRSRHTSAQLLDWFQACCSWSLHASHPGEIPERLRGWFPVWGPTASSFLTDLNDMLMENDDLPGPVQRRVAQFVVTAAKVADAAQSTLSNAPVTGEALPALAALIHLAQAVREGFDASPHCWQPLHSRNWAAQALRSVLDESGKAVRPQLAASLLEAYAPSDSGSINVWRCVLGPLWTRVLERVNPHETFSLLSPEAYRFAVSQVASLPADMRDYVLRESPAEFVLPLADWGVLLGSVSLPPQERVAELLRSSLIGDSFAVANWLWTFHPDQCISWAVDSAWPCHRILLEACPGQHALKVLEAIEDRAQTAPMFSSWQEWIASRIGSCDAESRRRLIGILSSHSRDAAARDSV